MISDPIEFELFKNSLFSIADEMALTIFRTTYSGVLKDNMDYSTAMFDGSGKLAAQGLTLPGHLGSMPTAMAAIQQAFAGKIEPGDVFILNDPFQGGMHLPDIFVFKPIFAPTQPSPAGGRGKGRGRAELLAYAATVCHHTDVGGRVPGSNASDSTEIFQEGLRIPPLKLFDRSVRNDTLYALIERNVRMPVKVFGDLRAQLAACHIAEQAFLGLVERYGVETVKAHMQELMDYTERLTRAAIGELPDGEWSFEDWIDDDGIDRGQPIPLRVTIRKRGDRLVADWTGSSPQVKGAINSTLSFTKAATFTCVKSVLAAEIPNNEGFFRAIEVIAPPGTITNCVLPAACAARGLTGFRMVDTCFGALAQMLPDRVPAASDGGATGVSIGGYHADRTPFIQVDFLMSAWGARPWADGLDGNAHIFGNLSSQPAEVCETEHPVEILCFEFIQDAGGPGKYRGGMSLRRDYRLVEAEATLQVRADRRAFRPYGLQGGRPGRASQNFLITPEGETRLLPAKVTMTMKRGEVFRHEQAGPGGWGDPLERDPERVLRDVRNELVSLAAARDDYGVVIDPAVWRVDLAATRARRGGLKIWGPGPG